MKISILGCGWLGLPLALRLQQKGHEVKGSRTSEAGARELSEQGIKGYAIQLGAQEIIGDDNFWQADILVINIPPPRDNPEQLHVQQATILIEKILLAGRIKHVLFISSTSVYANNNTIVTEEDTIPPNKASGRALRAIETLLLKQKQFSTTVLRAGGLIGYDRMPNAIARFSLNRDWDSPMNVIHRDDLIGIIDTIVHHQVWGEIFNACMDGHPARRDYYRAAAVRFGFQLEEPAPATGTPFKIVSTEKLKKSLPYHFITDEPLKLFNSDIQAI